MKNNRFFLISLLLTFVSQYQGFYFFSMLIGLIPAVIISVSFELSRITALRGIIGKRKTLQSSILYVIVAITCAFAATNSFIIESHERELIAIEDKKAVDLEKFKERARVGAIIQSQYELKISEIEKTIDHYRQQLARRSSDYYEARIIDREKEIDVIRKRLSEILSGSLDTMYYESGEEPRIIANLERSRYSMLVEVIARRWNLDYNHVIFLIALLITCVIEAGIITAGIVSRKNESNHEEKNVTRKRHVTRKVGNNGDNSESDYEKFSLIVTEKGYIPPARETNPNLRKAREEYIKRES